MLEIYEEYPLHHKFNGDWYQAQSGSGCTPAQSQLQHLNTTPRTSTCSAGVLPALQLLQTLQKGGEGECWHTKITSWDLIKTTEPVSLVIYGRFEPVPPEGENEGISSTLADFNSKVKSDVLWPSSERRLRSPCYPNYFWLDLWDVSTTVESSHNQVPALMGQVQSLPMPWNPGKSIRNLQQNCVINGMFHGEKGTWGIFPPLPADTWPPQELMEG